MAFFDDMFKGDVVSGILIGTAVGVVAKVLLPGATGTAAGTAAGVTSSVVRPVLKTVLWGGIVVTDALRSGFANLSEGVSDMVAEVRHEQHAGASTGAAAPSPEPTTSYSPTGGTINEVPDAPSPA